MQDEKLMDGKTWRRRLIANGSLRPGRRAADAPPAPFDWAEHGYVVLRLRGDESRLKPYDPAGLEQRTRPRGDR